MRGVGLGLGLGLVVSEAIKVGRAARAPEDDRAGHPYLSQVLAVRSAIVAAAAMAITALPKSQLKLCRDAVPTLPLSGLDGCGCRLGGGGG